MEVQSKTTLRDILYVLFRYKWLVLFLFGIILCGGVALTALAPKIYETSSTVQITFNNARLSMTSTEYNSRPTVEQQIFTEIEFVKSWGVVNAALDTLRNQRDVPEGLGFSEVLDNLRVESIRNTTMIIIYYRNVDPEFARDFLNQLVTEYIDSRSMTTMRNEEENRYQGMLEDLNARIEKVDDDLNQFKTKHEIFDIDVQLAQESSVLEQLRKSLIEIQRKIFHDEIFIKDLDNRLIEFNPDQLPTTLIARDQGLNRLLEMYNQMESEYLIKSSLYTDSNPEMLQSKTSLKSIAQELRNRFAASIDAERRSLQMDKLEQDLLLEEIETVQYRIQNLTGATGSSKNLEKRLSDLQSIRTVLSQKLEETRIQARGDDRILYSQVSPARAPIVPKSPNVGFNLLASLMIALILSLLTPFYVQLFDGRIVSDSDAVKATSQLLITSIRFNKGMTT